jgi:hypothetical protein
MNHPHKKSAAFILIAWLTLASYGPVGIGYCSDLVLCIGQNQEALVESGRNGLCGPATNPQPVDDTVRLSSRRNPRSHGHCHGCLDITISARTTNTGPAPVLPGELLETGSVSVESACPVASTLLANQIIYPLKLKPPDSPTLLSFHTISLQI